MTRTPWPAGLAFLLACGPNFEPVDPPDQPGAFAVSYARFTAVDATRDNRALPVEVWYPVDPADAEGRALVQYPLAPLIN